MGDTPGFLGGLSNDDLPMIFSSFSKKSTFWKSLHESFLSRNRDGTPSSTAASLACSEAALRIVGKIKAADVCGIELK